MKVFKIIFLVFLCCSFSYDLKAQSLRTLQLRACEENPGLQAKYKRVESLLERVDQVSALQDPKLSFGYFLRPVETRVGPQQARISLSQMFPWFGTRSLQAEAASLEAEAAFEQFKDARNALAFEVADSYYDLYAINKILLIQTEHIELLKELRTIAEEQYSAAKASLADIIRLDIQIENAETQWEVSQEKKLMLEAQMNELLAQPITNKIAIEDSLMIEEYVFPIQSDNLWEDHPRLRSTQLLKEAQSLGESAAKKRGMPQIGVGLDYVIVGDRQDAAGMSNPPAANGQDALMPMVSVSLPIFRKKYKAEQKQKVAMQEYYQLQHQATQNNLIADYSASVYQLRQSMKLIDLYKGQLTKTQQVRNLYLTAYANDEIGIEELINVQQQQLSYQEKLATATATYGIAIAKFKYMLNDMAFLASEEK